MPRSPDEGADQDDWVRDVLAFWFDELEPKDWFVKSDKTDALITARFGALYERLATVDVSNLTSEPQTGLAAILVFDQFPRNMFRNTPQAFATDAKALQLARAMVDSGSDRKLATIDQRVFVYLPFEHSEDVGDQDRSVSLIGALGNERYTQYAEAHRDVIRTFGRFPHRNDILGRKSTPEEEAYLAKPGSGF